MNMDQGIAVGMVIAELITNAFKHAFSADQGGNISICLTVPEDKADIIELTVTDNGSGLPPEIDLQNVSSLGLRLVVGIVTHELGGSIKVEHEAGTEFVIRFTCAKTNTI